MGRAVILPLLFAAVVLTEAAVAPPEMWDRHLTLDEAGVVNLFWTVSDEEILFEVHARTKGYVAIGFSPNGKMPGSDMAVGWVADGNASIIDVFAKSRIDPIPDEQQDYQLMKGYENSTHTILRFKRKLDTCDANDLRITNDTMRVIYAFHNEDPRGGKILYHGGLQRGTKSVYLTEKSRPEPSMKENTLVWDIRQPNITLPDNESTYWCKIVKAPEISQKHHIIAYKPLLNSNEDNLVHHMLFYECRMNNSDALYSQYLAGQGHECYTPTMPMEYSHCSTILIAWGVGSEGGFTPVDVGFPFGDEYNGAKYFMLEIHYENKHRRTGLIDDSGLRILYTPEVRLHDASVLNVGHVVSPLQIIPPRQETFVSVGHCSSECTRQLIPTSGVTIFDVFLHAHRLAKGIKLRHIRGGTELPPIIDEQNYDFKFLQPRKLNHPVQVLPGDHLIAECTYDSRETIKTSVGGLNMKQEMCLVFAQYYPRINLSECQSWPSLSALTDWFNIKLGQYMNNFIVEEPETARNQTLVQFLEQYQWDRRIAEYQREVRFGDYMPFCLKSGRFPLSANITVESYPAIRNPYYTVSEMCTMNKTRSDVVASVTHDITPLEDSSNIQAVGIPNKEPTDPETNTEEELPSTTVETDTNRGRSLATTDLLLVLLSFLLLSQQL